MAHFCRRKLAKPNLICLRYQRYPLLEKKRSWEIKIKTELFLFRFIFNMLQFIKFWVKYDYFWIYKIYKPWHERTLWPFLSLGFKFSLDFSYQKHVKWLMSLSYKWWYNLLLLIYKQLAEFIENPTMHYSRKCYTVWAVGEGNSSTLQNRINLNNNNHIIFVTMTLHLNASFILWFKKSLLSWLRTSHCGQFYWELKNKLSLPYTLKILWNIQMVRAFG